MWTRRLKSPLLCLFLIGCAAVAAEGEPDGATLPLVLKIETGSVDVYRPDGSLLQSLPCAGDEPAENNRDYFTFVEDMDFDGFPDVGVLFSQGMQNIYYDCWLWREEAGRFVKNEDMRDTANPRFDRERERVLSFEHVSASGSVETDYVWENGWLIPIERITREISGDSDKLVIRRFVRDDDGELRLSKEKMYSLAELNSDEGWGLESDYWLSEERPSLETDRFRDRAKIREIPVVNNLGFGLAAVYTHAPGHEPWKIAGPLMDGEPARVDRSNLRASRRLIVEKAQNGNAEAPEIQFFNAAYLDNVDRLRLELTFRDAGNGGGGIPALVTVEDGRKDAVIAGLPFDILLSFLESEAGLDSALYAELMFPLAADGWESYDFAVASGGVPWRLLSPGPVFREGEDGQKYLSAIAFGAGMTRRELLGFLDEFHGAQIMPGAVLMGDGTVYAFGEEAKKLPGAIPAVGTEGVDGGNPLAILKERLGEWIDRHCPPEHPDMKLFLESPEARYELRFNSGSDTAELRFQHKAATAAEEEAAGTPHPFVLKIGVESVDVYRPDGSLLQSLPCDGDRPDDDNRDFFAFVKDMEKLLLDAEFVDPADGDFLPSFGIPVYLAGADSPLRISVMDALIRIKKVVAPEDSPWNGDGRAAYRYDGPGTAAGKPAILFSFGADSREKFTAERHFAVDGAGRVYEMDILAGGEYRQREDAPPLSGGGNTPTEKSGFPSATTGRGRSECTSPAPSPSAGSNRPI